MVIVGGVSFWSEFQFIDRVERPASYPGIAADFRQTFATLRALPCDVFLGAHGVNFDLLRKLARHSKNEVSRWIDPDGHKDFVDDAERAFNRTFARQLQDAKQ